jgi:antitoxin CcdA
MRHGSSYHDALSAPKKPTNVSLSTDLLEEAKSLGVNISRACERGLAMQISEVRAQRWLDENKEAIDSSNAYVEKNGLHLAQYRQF